MDGTSAYRLAVVGLLLLAGAGACRFESPGREEASRRAEETGFRGRVIENPGPRPDFVLDAARGGTFDFREETEGRLALLFFGYTHCPDVCPIHMSSIAEVKRDLGLEFGRNAKVIFVTVDPSRDTPERLVSWLGGFDPEFIGLYGEPAKIDSIQLALGLPPAMVPGRMEAGEDARAAPPADYDVGHASAVVAFPPGDSIRVMFPFGTRQADWRHDLEILATLGGSE
jgi:protein SCO1/2